MARIILGKSKGVKTRVRYPAMTQGYISHTFSSRKDAEEYVAKLNSWQKRRAKITKA